jgi:hypothetical protein
VLQGAEAEGWTRDLCRHAYEAGPHNRNIATVAFELGLASAPAVEPAAPAPPPLWRSFNPYRGMLALPRHAIKNRWPCLELAVHSSELMPGGSPFFKDENSIERLYRRLETLFASAAKNFQGMTLGEFLQKYEG